MFNRTRIIIFLCFFALLAVYGAKKLTNPERLYAQAADASAAASTNSYKSIGVDAGVWNGGHAALWDLSIIDYFKYFGADERAEGYKPQQPINFSHPIHVQQHKIECQFCHWNVAKSAYANIPEVETCYGCHRVITLDDGTGKAKAGRESGYAEIKKIADYYTKHEPIPWQKVHVMPDHVRFNHKRHVKAGVGCQECHGQVPEMAVVQRVSSMKMGWCVDCHRQKGTSIDCYTCHK